MKVNDRQYIELYPGLEPGRDERLAHVCLETPISPPSPPHWPPPGFPIHAAQGCGGEHSQLAEGPRRQPDRVPSIPSGSLHLNTQGRALGANRIGSRLPHAGIVTRDVAAGAGWYRKRLASLAAITSGLHTGGGDRGTSGAHRHRGLVASTSVLPVLARGLPKERLKVRATDASADIYDPDGTRVELIAARQARD